MEVDQPNSTVLPSGLGSQARPAGGRRLLASWLHLGFTSQFEWNRLNLPIPGLSPVLQGLRIVHLSDTHLTACWSAAYDVLLERLRHDPPDLLLFTGDLVDAKLDPRPALPTAQRLVSGLSARLGVFGITGNHDGDLIGPRLEGWNMRYMPRRMVRLEADHAAVELIGLPGVRRTSFDPGWLERLPKRQRGVPRIVMGHYPDQVRHIGDLEADVMLCGHTHGGQICLPGGRAMMTHDELPRHMARGVHAIGETTLVVNRGFGMTKWPIRCFCPPEVIELRLCAQPEAVG